MKDVTMESSLEKYKADLKKLIEDGGQLQNAMNYEQYPDEVVKQLKEKLENEEGVRKFIRALPSFSNAYQAWYSEAKCLVKQLLPDRLDDFSALYEKPKNRRELTHGN